MKFIQYIDSVIKGALSEKGVRPFEFEFNGLKEMLSDPHIRFFTNDKNFNRFLICRGEVSEIIADLKDGRTYKIGTVDGDIPELPGWDEPDSKEAE